MTGHIYRDVILKRHVRLFRGAMDTEFLFMDYNTRPHHANIVEECLQFEDITRMDLPAYSPDLNPIEHVWDMLGRRIAARQTPSHLSTGTSEEFESFDLGCCPDGRFHFQLRNQMPCKSANDLQLCSDRSAAIMLCSSTTKGPRATLENSPLKHNTAPTSMYEYITCCKWGEKLLAFKMEHPDTTIYLMNKDHLSQYFGRGLRTIACSTRHVFSASRAPCAVPPVLTSKNEKGNFPVF
ncbi:transposable element Tcb1 transposase [Trichonephila clavipes]|nr:transposable element Tcb1 transposase [Trichonephila clavipes]